MRERNGIASGMEAVVRMEREAADATELLEMAEAEGDTGLIAEAMSALQALVDEGKRREIESLLSGEADGLDCFVEINAGAGGTEAQDWAEMILRMYTRWAERRGFKTQIMEESEGEQAGIKSVTIQMTGPAAYGWMKTEAGVHRLVRISPFDSQARRQTSFASVWVYPVIDDSIEIEINPADLRVDTYRASGAGGQHVNKTESAIRITHIPSGIVVACQTDRSQHRNRATAMGMLKARMYEAELQRREAASNTIEAAKTDIGWGHQIRNYVLAPYQLVKDLRTGVEKGNPDAVLDGALDDFMAAALAARAGATRSEASAQAQ
jgi:peptide chain release factor 2